LIDERFDGYRAQLVQRLAAVIQSQDADGSVHARRLKVEAQVSGLADVVVAGTKEISK
jgi:hypothetical protein